MTDAAALYQKLEDHMNSISAKIEVIERTKTPLLYAELNRDIAIGIELYQQYVDLLDSVTEKIENGEIA
jgi:hypothetical protein